MTAPGGWTYRVGLAGPPPVHVVEQIRARFGPVTVAAAGGLRVLEGRIADQPAVRALLTLVWDAGADVRLLLLSDDVDGR
ncbi:hypothetical protein [Geodermatophilus amargosae]|uniref:hypothetical protein n=1 Tax=Geodermatophilus amargosae TaxID=1296565 RepID=UPI0034DF7CF9